jgi:hypothetical protein
MEMERREIADEMMEVVVKVASKLPWLPRLSPAGRGSSDVDGQERRRQEKEPHHQSVIQVSPRSRRRIMDQTPQTTKMSTMIQREREDCATLADLFVLIPSISIIG